VKKIYVEGLSANLQLHVPKQFNQFQVFFFLPPTLCNPSPFPPSSLLLAPYSFLLASCSLLLAPWSSSLLPPTSHISHVTLRSVSHF
jgi:hypothetical protein